MDKFTLARALRAPLQRAADRDVRIEEKNDDKRVLEDVELTLASGGDSIPTW
jgi:hypothetical protein